MSDEFSRLLGLKTEEARASMNLLFRGIPVMAVDNQMMIPLGQLS